MTKKKAEKHTHLSAIELSQMNGASADAALAREQFAHEVTKMNLTDALHRASILQAEVNSLKVAEAARLATEQTKRQVQEALNHRNAKDKIVRDLAQDLRARYALGDKFQIDPMSGEFIEVES